MIYFSAFNPGEEGAEDILEGSIKGQWSVEPKFVMEMCDLSLPMSASRNRLLTAEDGQPNFGTTVTVLMKNDGENLKSSLKKPRYTITNSFEKKVHRKENLV